MTKSFRFRWTFSLCSGGTELKQNLLKASSSLSSSSMASRSMSLGANTLSVEQYISCRTSSSKAQCCLTNKVPLLCLFSLFLIFLSLYSPIALFLTTASKIKVVLTESGWCYFILTLASDFRWEECLRGKFTLLQKCKADQWEILTSVTHVRVLESAISLLPHPIMVVCIVVIGSLFVH